MTILYLDGDRVYVPSDAIAYAIQKARHFGVECLVAMRLGNEESAYTRAGIAFRWAVESGFYRREEGK